MCSDVFFIKSAEKSQVGFISFGKEASSNPFRRGALGEVKHSDWVGVRVYGTELSWGSLQSGTKPASQSVVRGRLMSPATVLKASLPWKQAPCLRHICISPRPCIYYVLGTSTG